MKRGVRWAGILISDRPLCARSGRYRFSTLLISEGWLLRSRSGHPLPASQVLNR
ncbi:hypothetical protein AAA17_002069 [Salmonella enterica subsp. enterica serovar Ohio]|nr:hypothetical protein [Salmonella enterica subsp. enterica serovar Livingstone]EDT1993798.1 hypothetical protein [Salmonella enterica subsp. enterica serovar Miami]EDU9510739.1 hypothetical protein [Salmonella enterica subsp. enterica serovar Ohio]EED7519008.1 hypothetical protein [Salmonella enterica subsp. enterica]HAF1409914.1 hypothetical protein [Salmonella enterica]